MLKIKEILRLSYKVGLSLREIGKACNCGKSTVSDILSRAKNAGITWPNDLSDKKLMSLLYPSDKSKTSHPEPDMDYVFCEMKKKGVTLMLLWEEYKEQHPDGLMYTQFCERYKNFKKNNKIVMHKEHKAGEEMEVDWAGSTMSYINRSTGEIIPVYIFVAVLPASNYPFAYGYENMKTPSWIDAHVRAFEYFGGVARITIPDNTKTAVTKPDLIDPVLNKSYYEMARHYHTTIIPARAGKPKDKAKDENAVGNISRRVIAVLRNRQFFSLYEVNQAISEALKSFVERPFQKMEGNRKLAFEKIDKLSLQPLPSTKYEYAEWKEAKVQFNYHVEYDGYYYSCHYSYVGYNSSIRATTRTIEVYIDGERVAAYARNKNPYKRYTTLPEHMPEEHKIVSGWSSERFLSWAGKIGPNTKELIDQILNSREYPVQTYRACMGIMRYTKNYSSDIIEKTSKETLDKHVNSYKYFSLILKQILNKEAKTVPEKIISNDNLRGINSFVGGGIIVK